MSSGPVTDKRDIDKDRQFLEANRPFVTNSRGGYCEIGLHYLTRTATAEARVTELEGELANRMDDIARYEAQDDLSKQHITELEGALERAIKYIARHSPCPYVNAGYKRCHMESCEVTTSEREQCWGDLFMQQGKGEKP